MDAANPEGTGSFGLNRLSGSQKGTKSVAVGNNTTASGANSLAQGKNTVAYGGASHAEGDGTVAYGYAQHAEGTFNIPDGADAYVHIAGNGLDENSKSNAYTLDWDGNGWFAGDVYVGSTGGVNKDAGSKKLQTEAIADAGGYFTTDTVEAALQEIGAKLAAYPSDVWTGGSF